jgi:hypothetical protein
MEPERRLQCGHNWGCHIRQPRLHLCLQAGVKSRGLGQNPKSSNDLSLLCLGDGNRRIAAEDQAARDIGAPSFHTTLQCP